MKTTAPAVRATVLTIASFAAVVLIAVAATAGVTTDGNPLGAAASIDWDLVARQAAETHYFD